MVTLRNSTWSPSPAFSTARAACTRFAVSSGQVSWHSVITSLTTITLLLSEDSGSVRPDGSSSGRFTMFGGSVMSMPSLPLPVPLPVPLPLVEVSPWIDAAPLDVPVAPDAQAASDRQAAMSTARDTRCLNPRPRPYPYLRRERTGSGLCMTLIFLTADRQI